MLPLSRLSLRQYVPLLPLPVEYSFRRSDDFRKLLVRCRQDHYPRHAPLDYVPARCVICLSFRRSSLHALSFSFLVFVLFSISTSILFRAGTNLQV